MKASVIAMFLVCAVSTYGLTLDDPGVNPPTLALADDPGVNPPTLA